MAALSLAGIGPDAIAEAIYPAGFYNTKARQLEAIGATLRDEHGGRVASGVYFVRLTAGTDTAIRKIIVLR